MPGAKPNRLLNGLSIGDHDVILSLGTRVGLKRGIDLAQPSVPAEFCWFPTSGLISVIAMDADGAAVEVGMIGSEGVVNAPLIFGLDMSPYLVTVQIEGDALRVSAAALHLAMIPSQSLAFKLLAYSHVLAVQFASSALAFARHPVDRRLARWLLMCQDRVGDRIDLTHETLSTMLGARRAGVTIALHLLENRGAISTARGSITIVDRMSLLNAAGSGYGLSEHVYARLLGRLPA